MSAFIVDNNLLPVRNPSPITRAAPAPRPSCGSPVGISATANEWVPTISVPVSYRRPWLWDRVNGGGRGAKAIGASKSIGTLPFDAAAMWSPDIWWSAVVVVVFAGPEVPDAAEAPAARPTVLILTTHVTASVHRSGRRPALSELLVRECMRLLLGAIACVPSPRHREAGPGA